MKEVHAQNIRIIDSIAFNLHLQVHTAYFSGQAELGENVPRFGTLISRKVGNKTSAFGKLEYGLNLARGTQFNNNANSPSEFVSDPFQEPEPFSLRLAYLGIAHEILGAISLGKQWGVYYDVGQFTDNFTVFGSSAADVYAGNTDGGWKGTGRADEAVVYRNRIGKFQIGLQTQLFGSHTNFGSSLTYAFSDRLKAGVAFNHAEIPGNFRQLVNGLNGNSNTFIAGYGYNDDKLYSGLTFAVIEHEYLRIDDETLIAFPVCGVEFLNRYAIHARVKIEGGFNYKWQRGDVAALDENYRLLQFYAGLNYYFGNMFSIYLQGRLDQSRKVVFPNNTDVILLGLSFDLNKSIDLFN
ncbi:porin [Robertkochia aurantiaca]|uniref:porin n=1 Tax=Robertkochia aurantiaca TaxID=2873700 RepID=UPI001CCE521D